MGSGQGVQTPGGLVTPVYRCGTPWRTPVLLLVVAVMACSVPAPVSAARKGPMPGTLTNVYLEEHVTSELGFDRCKGYALQGHCEFYSCLDEALMCGGSKHNRSVAYRFCDMARHHASHFSAEGRRWAHDTNRCVLKVIASARRLRRHLWCSRVDAATKQALVDCARAADICDVLWSDREVLHRVFSTGSWLTVVEAAKQCPRAVVNSFIFWTLGQMHIYRR